MIEYEYIHQSFEEHIMKDKKDYDNPEYMMVRDLTDILFMFSDGDRDKARQIAWKIYNYLVAQKVLK